MTKQAAGVAVLTYAPIGRLSSGPANTAHEIAIRLSKSGNLAGVVCHGAVRGSCDIPASKVLVPPSRFVYLVTKKLVAALDGRMGIHSRSVMERFFDKAAVRSRNVRKAGTLLYLKPAFPETARVAKQKGKINIAWASVFHPKHNEAQILKELERTGSIDGGSYTDSARVSRIDRFFQYMDKIVVQSELARSSYQEAGIPADKLVLFNAEYQVDLRRFGAVSKLRNDDQVRFLHVSHMSLIKGVHILLDAWERASLKNVRLDLVGRVAQNYQGVLDRKARPDSVRFHGATDSVESFYGFADIFVSPSVADNLPNTVLEAMASGVPVIVSNRCGLSEIVDDGVNGFVYEYDNVAQLAELLTWCATNRDALREMGAAARSKVNELCGDGLADRLVNWLRSSEGRA